MHPNALAEELERDPFIPLRITLSNGERIDIANPGLTYIIGLSLYILKPGTRYRRIMQDHRVISLRHIASVDLLDPADHANGANPA